MENGFLLTHSLEKSARFFPDRIAFKCGGREINYRSLLNSVNYFADQLSKLEVGRGDRVGIFMNRCLETSIAIYTIMQAGGVYVPLDPKAPKDRHLFQVNNCNIEVLLTTKTFVNHVQSLGKQALIIEEKSLEEEFVFERDFPLLEEDAAYILYTSGSTGVPKGIVHTHRSGLAYAKLTANTFSITEKDIIANHAPIYFDISTLGYFTGPYCGACTVILTDGHVVMHASLAQLLETEKISIWYSVPRAIVQLVDTGLLDALDLSNLRWLLYAGEAFPVNALRRAMSSVPNTTFCNIYGPTETNQCTHYIFDKIPEETDDIPIGQVWDNTEYLIDNNELLIRSATVMLGYWDNATLTSNSFFIEENDAPVIKKFYRTGDLVEEREDGLLYLMGRKDHQIKIRGFRVELGEVERAILFYEGVEESAVVTEQKNGLNQEIIGFVRSSVDIDEKSLIKFLKTKIPHYAIPSKFYKLDTFPRTPNGKVDRKRLSKQNNDGG